MWVITIIVLLCSGCAVQQSGVPTQSRITLYNYHTFSPYYLSDINSPSLSSVLAENLSQLTGLNIHVEYIDRKQLNQKINAGQSVMVVWANPKWFSEITNIAVSTSLVWDSDVVLQLKQPELSELPSTARRKTFCAVSGYNYSSFYAQFPKASLHHVYVDALPECIELVKSGMADYMQIVRSALYNENFAQYLPLFEIVGAEVDSFTRHIIATADNKQHIQRLSQAIDELQKLSQWKTSLSEFGEQQFIDLFETDLATLLDLEIK